MRGVLALLVLAGCFGRDSDALVERDVVFATPAGNITVNAEVVWTSDKIARGMNGRTQLAPNGGMLFELGREKNWSFWMRDTLIPLDMIFISKDLNVVGVVANAQPGDERPRRVDGLSTRVLEVNAGWAAAHGVERGTPVRFGPRR
jgi:uncharacterized membrane protein (UPF0127 family)